MLILLARRAAVSLILLNAKTIGLMDWASNYPQRFGYNVVQFNAIVLALVITFSPAYKTLSYKIKTSFSEQLGNAIISHQYAFLASNNPNNIPVVLGAADESSSVPVLTQQLLAPKITARSALVVDASTGKTLFELESNLKLAPASTTKLMTALVSLDLYNLSDKLSVPSFCTAINSQRAGFTEDQELSVEDLLYALLVSSAGDAACTLSVGKTSYEGFVNLMNQKALLLGMQNTVFTNPIGLDGVESSHYSTAKDLFNLSQKAVSNTLLRKIVSTKDYEIMTASSDNEGLTHLSNTNRLLWDIPGSVGIKTGTTFEAGEVLIYEYKDDLKDLVIIVMGSQDRFSDTVELLRWTLRSYTW